MNGPEDDRMKHQTQNSFRINYSLSGNEFCQNFYHLMKNIKLLSKSKIFELEENIFLKLKNSTNLS
jgi:hypothetical protein